MKRALLVLVSLWCLACSGLGSSASLCAWREVCAEEGQCGTSGEVAGEGGFRCYPRDAADCAASEACTRDGRCALETRVALRCISERRAKRVPAVSACAASPDCARWGRCGAVEGACLAVDDADCKASLDCVVGGKCTRVGNHCLAGSDADCAGSLECQAYGRCVRFHHPLLGTGGACVEPGNDAFVSSCNYAGAGADRCAQTGECLMNPDGTCERAGDLGLPTTALDDVRRRLRNARPVEKPSDLR